MKRLILAVVAVTVLAGIGLYLNRPKAPPVSAPEPAAETPVAATTEEPQPAESATTSQPTPPVPVQPARTTGITSVAASTSPSVASGPNPVLDASLLSRTVDVLVSPQATYLQKRDAWGQLRDSGKLDQAIADLEQRMTNEPRAAEIPASLGQAYLQKCSVIKDVREQGILAMQADKVFDTALNLDPSNWEARFTKAVALSYWPPMLNKGEEVIQHFQTLIQQQEAQTPQPQFAETYAWLGDQYQKTGRADDARAVWQRGASLFPADEKLRTKLAPAQ